MQKKLKAIYENLLFSFGHQGWWPASTRDEVVIGAILASNVSWKNVEKAISRLRLAKLLSLSALYSADPEAIAENIRSTRFYNQKTKRLKAFCNFLVSDFNGSLDKLFAHPMPGLRHKLLSLNGFGPETVDSILLYAGDIPVFVIDAYTRRIFCRMGLGKSSWDYTDFQNFFHQNLPHDTGLFNDFHAQIVALGNRVCRPGNPLCSDCPVSAFCSYASEYSI